MRIYAFMGLILTATPCYGSWLVDQTAVTTLRRASTWKRTILPGALNVESGLSPRKGKKMISRLPLPLVSCSRFYATLPQLPQLRPETCPTYRAFFDVWLQQGPLAFTQNYPVLASRAKKLYAAHSLHLPEVDAHFRKTYRDTLDEIFEPKPHKKGDHVTPYTRARIKLEYYEKFLKVHQALGHEEMANHLNFMEKHDLLHACHAGFTAVDAIEILTDLEGQAEAVLQSLQQQHLIKSSWDSENIFTLLKVFHSLQEQREEVLSWFRASPWRQVIHKAAVIETLFDHYLEDKQDLITFDGTRQGQRSILRCDTDDQVLDLLRRRRLHGPGYHPIWAKS
ncbi:MAG: hypothetical protein ACK5O7_01805 [Holosporales bacterium]